MWNAISDNSSISFNSIHTYIHGPSFYIKMKHLTKLIKMYKGIVNGNDNFL